jgi:hypothetical protein
LIQRKRLDRTPDIFDSSLQVARGRGDFRMRRLCPALYTPIDPVVTVHRSRGEADASLSALRCAGFRRGMLAVIGERRPDGDTRHIADEFGCQRSAWTDSGFLWGLLWAIAAVAAASAVPPGGSAFGLLLMAGALALVVHVAIVSRLVAPENDAPGLPPMRTSRRAEDPAASSPWRFVVVVRGSRSDIALARTILAHHEPAARSPVRVAG